jgi:gamma-glutamyltranspeptidase/glutathione hydrolase
VPEFADDLRSYRVGSPPPLETSVLGRRILSMPGPSLGGAVVHTILETFAESGEQTLGDRARAVALAYGSSGSGPLTGTTHTSVVDSAGMAAALSSTLGSGSGIFRAGTQLNNMLGELDVIGPGEHQPGERLASMMTPTLVLSDGRPRLVIGSAGSVRLAGAIAQVTWRILRGTPVEEAINASRLHVDGTTVHLEGGLAPTEADDLEARWDVVRWDGRNLFFGGVQAVERTEDGALAAAGDPRRGGVGLVVE